MRAFKPVLTMAVVGWTVALAAEPVQAQWGLPYSYSSRQVRAREVRIDGYSVSTRGLVVSRTTAATWLYGSTGPYQGALGGGCWQGAYTGVPRSTERAGSSVGQYRDWQREMWAKRRR